jgi:hypothetical protein
MGIKFCQLNRLHVSEIWHTHSATSIRRDSDSTCYEEAESSYLSFLSTGTDLSSEISGLLMEVLFLVFDHRFRSDNPRLVNRYQRISVSFIEDPSDFID